MAKVKIKPFFYLILRRDENGKLHFDVYDFAEEGGSLLKTISDDNALLKHEDRKEEIEEYVDTLIKDIAEAYSRMGRIILSYRGSTKDEMAVKRAIKQYNEKHKYDETSPLIIYKGIAGNVSIEEYIEKVNQIVSQVSKNIEEYRGLTASLTSDELLISEESEYGKKDIHTFEKLMAERGDVNELLEYSVLYSSCKSDEERQALFPNLARALLLENEEEKYELLRYFEARASRAGKKQNKPKVQLNDFIFPEFSIKDDIEYSELLEYIDSKERDVEKTVQVIANIERNLMNKISSSKKNVTTRTGKLNTEINHGIEKDIEDFIKLKLETIEHDIEKAYKVFIKPSNDISNQRCAEDTVRKCGYELIDKYEREYNTKFIPKVKDHIANIDNRVYGIIYSNFQKNSVPSEAFSTDEYKKKYRFIDQKLKDELENILTTVSCDKASMARAFLTKGRLVTRNDYGVVVKKDKYIMIEDMDKFSSKIRDHILYFYWYNSWYYLEEAVEKRKEEYISKVLPKIIKSVRVSDNDDYVIKTEESIREAEADFEKAKSLYRNISLSLEDIRELKETFISKSGGEKK